MELSGSKRKQTETSSSNITIKESAPKKLITETIAVAPVRYNTQKQQIVPQTPLTPIVAPQSAVQEVIHVPPGAKQMGTTYQQALKALDRKGTVQYVFPHLAPNKGQAQQNDDGMKRHFRKAGFESWEDPTLTDWNPEDHRIFVGDLGNEVNDLVLIQAFSKYPSILKAKIIRDKRSGKTKGYGFVSFGDPADFAKALKEMNGKYIGNRPCKLRKSRWKEREDGEKPNVSY